MTVVTSVDHGVTPTSNVGGLMIRLVLLLLGARPLRAHWKSFIVLSGLSLAASLVFIENLFDSAIIVTIDLIGIGLVVEGVARLLTLAAIGFPNATLPVLKSLGFFALGLLAIDVPWDDNILATIVLGAALAIDGLFRIAGKRPLRTAALPRAG